MECNTENVCPLKAFFRKNKKVKYLLGVVLGALVGYLYYYFIGCSGGTCPITSNPYASISFGALAGYFIIKS